MLTAKGQGQKAAGCGNVLRKHNGAFRIVGLWLLSLVLLQCASCQYIPFQPAALAGEGPPPGYISGTIDMRYRGMRNPFSPNDPLVLVAGGSIYISPEPSCAACHGYTGRGNGVLWSYLEPRPADFAATPMLYAFNDHQDYTYWWVAEGIPRSSMPSWKNVLSEIEIWQVITYAWHLGLRTQTASSGELDQTSSRRHQPTYLIQFSQGEGQR